jgi:hypothetical protein
MLTLGEGVYQKQKLCVSAPSGITLGEEWKFYEIFVAEGHLNSALFKSLNINFQYNSSAKLLTEILVSTRNSLYHTNEFLLKMNFLTQTSVDTYHYQAPNAFEKFSGDFICSLLRM